MGLVSFAQGEMAMFATFVAYTLIERGLKLLDRAAAGRPHRVCRRRGDTARRDPARGARAGAHAGHRDPRRHTLVNGLAGFAFGYIPRSFPSPFSVQTIDVLGALVSFRDLGVIAVSGVVLVLITYCFSAQRSA
jgi:branched-chain amino acid transport system permease protein